MSPGSSFKDILEKYLKGEASSAERRLVEEWFELIGEKEERFSALSDPDKEQLFGSLRQSPRFRNTRRRRLFLLHPSWKAAAVWSGLLLGGWAIVQLQRSGKGNPVQDRQVTQVNTGRGEIRKLRLPDSSEVWLNANTIIRYAADFSQHRQLSLSGEALFDVTHHPGHPFIIETPDGLKTEVLGTRFDIKSYDQLPISEVTVIDGRIRVSHADSLAGELVHGQTVAWSRGDGKFRQSVVDHPESLSEWITGNWEFNNKGLDDLALLLNNQFGIRLVCRQADLQKARVSVNFNSKQTATEIIGIFCAFTDSHFRWKDSSTIEIY
jgi:transmembrane sensor